MVLGCLHYSEIVTAIQGARSAIRVPVEPSVSAVLPSSYHSRVILLSLVNLSSSASLATLSTSHSFLSFRLYFSPLFFKRVPVVTKSPYLSRHVRPSTSTSAASTEQISVMEMCTDICRENSNLFRIG